MAAIQLLLKRIQVSINPCLRDGINWFVTAELVHRISLIRLFKNQSHLKLQLYTKGHLGIRI